MKKMRTKVTAIAMMAMFIGAVFAAVCSLGIPSGMPATVLYTGDGWAPVTNITYSSKVIGTNGWNVTSVVINLTASDQQGDPPAYDGTKSDVNYTEYRIDTLNGATGVWTTGTWKMYYSIKVAGGAKWLWAKNVTLTNNNGTVKFNYRSVDFDGNNETVNRLGTGLKNVTFKFDQNKPTTTATVGGTATNGWYRAATNVTLKASDATSVDPQVKNNSGLLSTTYRLSTASSPTTVTYVNKTDMAAGVLVNITTTTQGTITLNYSSKDNASNVFEGATNVTIKMDSVAPTLADLPDDDEALTAGYFNFTADDATSKVSTVEISVDGGTAVTLTAVGKNYSKQLDAGTHNVTITVTDNAGNSVSQTVSNVTVAGAEPPVTPTDYTIYIIIIVIIIVVVVVAVLMMRRGKGKAPVEEAPAAEEKS